MKFSQKFFFLALLSCGIQCHRDGGLSSPDVDSAGVEYASSATSPAHSLRAKEFDLSPELAAWIQLADSGLGVIEATYSSSDPGCTPITRYFSGFTVGQSLMISQKIDFELPADSVFVLTSPPQPAVAQDSMVASPQTGCPSSRRLSEAQVLFATQRGYQEESPRVKVQKIDFTDSPVLSLLQVAFQRTPLPISSVDVNLSSSSQDSYNTDLGYYEFLIPSFDSGGAFGAPLAVYLGTPQTALQSGVTPFFAPDERVYPLSGGEDFDFGFTLNPRTMEVTGLLVPRTLNPGTSSATFVLSVSYIRRYLNQPRNWMGL